MALTKAILEKIDPNYGQDRLESTSQSSLRGIDLNHRGFDIGVVNKVYRRFLLAAFSLRKKEYYIRRQNEDTRILLHNTNPANIDSILRTNLDRRRVVRAKYGHGVSFTPDLTYGHKHSNGYLSSQAIVVAEVLNGNTCFEKFSKVVDTTKSTDGKVFVKYRDDEFMPKFIVYYNGPKKQSKYRRYNYDSDDYSYAYDLDF